MQPPTHTSDNAAPQAARLPATGQPDRRAKITDHGMTLDVLVEDDGRLLTLQYEVAKSRSRGDRADDWNGDMELLLTWVVTTARRTRPNDSVNGISETAISFGLDRQPRRWVVIETTDFADAENVLHSLFGANMDWTGWTPGVES